MIRAERHAAHHVAQRGSVKDGQQNTGQGEDGVEECLPDILLDVGSELDADGAQHEQPKHHHQRQVEAAEAGSI